MSWDVDVASMVHDVGAPYDMYFLGAYVNANLDIHATLASALRQDNPDKADLRRQRREKADWVLFCSALLMVEVVRSQNTLFSLGLGEDIGTTQVTVAGVWQEIRDAREGTTTTAS